MAKKKQEEKKTEDVTAPAPQLDEHSIHVKVYSPYQSYYDDLAQSISAENDTGPFDILPKHHNFITLVSACEVIIRVDEQQDKKIRITRGVMHVRSNKVTLFLDV
ncbi:MAG: F0F1 ATP synthase subunit epsilon [Candidatus Saccharimonadales bacterium]